MGILAELIPILTSILASAPQVINDVKSIWGLATATTAPTTDEQASIDAALEAAHKALQDS